MQSGFNSITSPLANSKLRYIHFPHQQGQVTAKKQVICFVPLLTYIVWKKKVKHMICPIPQDEVVSAFHLSNARNKSSISNMVFYGEDFVQEVHANPQILFSVAFSLEQNKEKEKFKAHVGVKSYNSQTEKTKRQWYYTNHSQLVGNKLEVSSLQLSVSLGLQHHLKAQISGRRSWMRWRWKLEVENCKKFIVMILTSCSLVDGLLWIFFLFWNSLLTFCSKFKL